MQPYFFPYIDHFRMMAKCDVWVFFDITQFRRKSWMHRNRIANRDKGWCYVNIPINHTKLETPIYKTTINHAQDWKAKIFEALKVYKGHAPYYDDTLMRLTNLLSSDCKTITDFNTHTLKFIAALLDVHPRFETASKLDVLFPENCGAGEWAYYISKYLGASIYLNPESGRELFDAGLYKMGGIQLDFFQGRTFEYDMHGFKFEPGLSVIDAMMWNSIDKLKYYIHQQE